MTDVETGTYVERRYRRHDYCIALGKDTRIFKTRQGHICARCGDRVDVYDPSVEEVKAAMEQKV